MGGVGGGESFEISSDTELKNKFVLILVIIFADISTKVYCKNMPHPFSESTKTKFMEKIWVIGVYLNLLEKI